jgi:FKBP-type peptidyl-prolyl cis-trans isomerase FkpA
MQKNFLVIIGMTLFLFGFSSCLKDNPSKQAKTDHAIIEEYAKANGLDGQFTDSGLYYVIITPGTDSHPSLSSNVTVDYKGYFLDGTIFDQGNNISFPLTNVIPGWQEGIQLIGSGGKITLLIPSGLAYGSMQRGTIPANSVLGFDVTLHSFTN